MILLRQQRYPFLPHAAVSHSTQINKALPDAKVVYFRQLYVHKVHPGETPYNKMLLTCIQREDSFRVERPQGHDQVAYGQVHRLVPAKDNSPLLGRAFYRSRIY